MEIADDTVRMLAEISSYASMFSESEINFYGSSCFKMFFKKDYCGVLFFDDVLSQAECEYPIIPLIIQTLQLWCKPSTSVDVDYKTFTDFAKFVFKHRVTIKRFHFEGSISIDYVFRGKTKTVTQSSFFKCFKVMKKNISSELKEEAREYAEDQAYGL